MKILFLTNIPSPYRVKFFNELGKRCELTVLYEKKIASDRNSAWLNEENGLLTYKSIYMKVALEGASSAFCTEIIKYIKKKNYDIFVVGVYSTPTGMYAIQYLRKKKIPFVINCDGGFPGNGRSLKEKLKKYLIGSASTWLSTGSVCDEYLEFYGAKVEGIYRYSFTSLDKEDIWNCPAEFQEKNQLRKRLGISEKKVLLSVGQFIYRKGFDVLLEAANYMDKQYGIYIIGDEPSKEYLDLKERYNLENVHFIGFMTKEELKEYYRAADLFVLPTREDIWGLVINEAMAAGLPVVTTEKCIAGLELIQTKSCLIPSENSSKLAEIISQIMENEELRKKIAIENTNKIKNYNYETMAARHVEIFTNVLEKRKM